MQCCWGPRFNSCEKCHRVSKLKKNPSGHRFITFYLQLPIINISKYVCYIREITIFPLPSSQHLEVVLACPPCFRRLFGQIVARLPWQYTISRECTVSSRLPLTVVVILVVSCFCSLAPNFTSQESSVALTINYIILAFLCYQKKTLSSRSSILFSTEWISSF